MKIKDRISALLRVHEELHNIVDRQGLTWDEKYDFVFCDEISEEVYRLWPKFSYYDPDTSYEDDVMAFVHALDEIVDRLKKDLNNENSIWV